jgi:hypothetical protein
VTKGAEAELFTARQELERVLDAEHAKGVVDHRTAKRAKLTPFAARLLAKEFAKCADPNAAAEAMIVFGWTGFKVEWMERGQARSSYGRQGGIEAAKEALRRRVQDELGSSREGIAGAQHVGRLGLIAKLN